MWSPNAPSLNTHQLALSNLKERCSKQQKKLDDLERDKLVLNIENEELAKTLRKLNDDNMEIRERNLEINHELKESKYEIMDLKHRLDNVGRDSPSSSKDLSIGKCFIIVSKKLSIKVNLRILFRLLIFQFHVRFH